MTCYTFVFSAGDGIDTVGDFNIAQDLLDFTSYGLATKQDVLNAVTDNGADTSISLSAGDTVNLRNIDHLAITEDLILI